jgi:signal transduction histidine kinase
LGLSDAYEKLKNYKNAVEAYQKYILIKDSILNEITAQQIEKLNIQFQTEKKEKEIAEQQTHILQQQLKYKQRNYLTLSLGMFVLLILIIGGYIYYNQKQKQLHLIQEIKLKDELTAVKINNKIYDERLKISSELNDKIGANLTYIISSIDNLKLKFNSLDGMLLNKLTDISNFTKNTISQLRETIWALNKQALSFEDLIPRLYNYIETANLAQDQTQFIFEHRVTSTMFLNSLQGVNIYRIIQEAINNAIKYAAATKVQLLINEVNDNVVIQIIDDGIGFNMSEIVLGNGLENMKNRAAAIHAKFNIDSFPDKGTAITVTINKSRFNQNKANDV